MINCTHLSPHTTHEATNQSTPLHTSPPPENDPVEGLPSDQLYCVLAMEEAGRDLEAYRLSSFHQACSVLLQVGGARAGVWVWVWVGSGSAVLRQGFEEIQTEPTHVPSMATTQRRSRSHSQWARRRSALSTATCTGATCCCAPPPA